MLAFRSWRHFTGNVGVRTAMIQNSRKILITCRGMGGNGSVAEVARKQAEQLRKHFEVTLISDSFPYGWTVGTQILVKPLSFDFMRRFCHVPNELAFVCAVRRAVGRMIGNSKFDLFYCHGHVIGALGGKWLTRRYGIPFAMVTHGDIFDRPKGTYDPLLTGLYRWVTPRAYRAAALVITLSPFMQDLAIKGGAEARRVAVMPNGIDPSAIGLATDAAPSRQKLERKSKREKAGLNILFVGRLSPEKGVDVLLEACSLIRKEGVEFFLNVVGGGPDMDVLRLLAARSGIADCIRFVGSVPRKELADWYSDADVVCLPSRSDSFPGVMLEALVSGTPVVGSRTGGIPAVVADGENGILVDTGSPRSLANALKKIAEEDGFLAKLQQRAHSTVWPEYSWDSVGAHLAAAIEKLLRTR